MYPFCFLGTRRGDGGCTLSAEAGGVGVQLSGVQLSGVQFLHLFNNRFSFYSLQVCKNYAII
jgi:hypothetical protein